MERPHDHPCPSCGFLVFGEPPGSYDICPVCGWEDDHVQLKYPLMRGGANGGSLLDYQRAILREVPAEVRVHLGYVRARGWRPLRPEDHATDAADAPGSGTSYFEAATEGIPPYYWDPVAQQVSRDELERSWKVTTRRLETARALLPKPAVQDPEVGTTIAAYEGMLSHNELELALDALEGVGELNHCPPRFWRELLAAAENMGLREHAASYKERLGCSAESG